MTGRLGHSQPLSQRREAQFRDGKNAFDTCKELLDYKKDKKLCR